MILSILVPITNIAKVSSTSFDNVCAIFIECMAFALRLCKVLDEMYVRVTRKPFPLVLSQWCTVTAPAGDKKDYKFKRAHVNRAHAPTLNF